MRLGRRDVATALTPAAGAWQRVGMSWIQVHSHRSFNLLEPAATDVVLADVAHSLSIVARFNGHTVRHYPVAQHALAVSVHCEALALEAEYPRECDGVVVTPAVLGLWGLHHDDDEAYLGDPTRPYLQALAMVNEAAARAVRVLKRRVQAAVAGALGLPAWFAEHSLVKNGDNAALGAEARELLRGGPVDDWSANLPALHPTAMSVVRSVYTPAFAEEMFLARNQSLLERAARELAVAEVG